MVGKNIFIAGSSSALGQAFIETLSINNNIYMASRELSFESNSKHFSFCNFVESVHWGNRLPKKLDFIFVFIGNEQPLKYITDISAEEFHNAFETNVFSVIFFTKAIFSSLQEDSMFFTISSRLSKTPENHSSMYCCSKAALNMLTKCLNVELSPNKGRFFTIFPVPFLSLMQDALLKDKYLSATYSSIQKHSPQAVAHAIISACENIPKDLFDCLNLHFSNGEINHTWDYL